MRLNYAYDSIDDVPEKFRELYEERDGRAIFVGGDGFKTQADVDRLQGALTKERDAHKATKAKYKGLDGIDADAVQALRDENEDLKARVEAGGGQIDEKKLDELAERKAVLKTRPLERKIAELTQQVTDLTGANTGLVTEKNGRTIVDAIREATRGEKGIKIVDTAMADIEFLAPSIFAVADDGSVRVRDGAPGGALAGASPREWLAEIQSTGARKHWFPGSVGAGARDGGNGHVSGTNPFDAKTFNFTEVNRLVKTDPTAAKRLATAANRLDLLPKELQA